MAIDTRDKRASAAGIALVFLLQPPLPDGSITGVDKQHACNAYRGIAAAAPSLSLDGDKASTLGPGAHIQTDFPDDIAVPAISTDLTDCYVYEAQICTRLEFNTPISLVNDYDAQIDLPGDYLAQICALRNEFDTQIDTENDFSTQIGCA